MKQKLIDLLNNLKKKLQPQIDQLIVRLQPLNEYWKRQTERDQQILMGVGVIMVLMILAYIISSAMAYKDELQSKVIVLERYKIYSEVYARQFKDLSRVTPNDFSTVSSERIKNDATSVLGVTEPTVLLSDGTLTVKADNVKFDSVVDFLDQLRKSYGLFPDSLKVTRMSNSGYVSFSVTFINVEL